MDVGLVTGTVGGIGIEVGGEVGSEVPEPGGLLEPFHTAGPGTL